jgi:hypothetical protein
VAGEVGGFVADDLAEPVADEGAVVVVDPAFVAGVVRRVDVDAFDLARVVGQQGLERDEVVALDDEIAATGVAEGEIGHVLKQVERDFEVVIHHGVLADPVQRGHERQSTSG